ARERATATRTVERAGLVGAAPLLAMALDRHGVRILGRLLAGLHAGHPRRARRRGVRRADTGGEHREREQGESAGHGVSCGNQALDPRPAHAVDEAGARRRETEYAAAVAKDSSRGQDRRGPFAALEALRDSLPAGAAAPPAETPRG